MATLQELESDFLTIQDNVRALRKQMPAKSELKNFDKRIQDFDAEIADLQAMVSGFEAAARREKDPAIKKDYESKVKTAQADILTKQQEKADLEAKRASRLSIEQQISDAKDEMDRILAEFAQDPRINQHLQEAITIEFDKATAELETKITDQGKLATKLGQDLADDSVFGTKVKAFVDAANAKNAINPYVTDPKMIKENERIQQEFTKALIELSKEIKSRSEYEGVELTQEDYESIIAGPQGGAYQLPSMEKAVRVLEAKKTKMEAEKTRIIGDIEKEKAVPGTVDLSQIEADIAAKEGEIQAKNDSIKKKKADIISKGLEITAKEQDSADLDTKIGAIAAKEPRLKELEDKTKIPQALIDDEKDTKTKYDKALQDLKAVGYISKDTIPELADDTSDISKAYKEFVAKDLAVRKAFAECKVNPDPTKKDELKKAIEEYEKEAVGLVGKSGFSTADWNRYLMSELNEKIANGEQIDEAYNTGLINSRVNHLAVVYDKYLDVAGVSKIDDSVDYLKDLDDLQQEILSGKKGSANFTDIENTVDDYHMSMKDVFDALKVKGINKLSDLYNTIKNGFTEKVGFFKRLFGKKYQDPAQPELDVVYPNGTVPASENFTTAKEEYEAAKKAKDEALAGKLSPEEQKELTDLKTEFAEKTKMEADKAIIDGEITTLTGERDTLEQDVQDLENDTSLEDELQDLQDERAKRAAAGVPPVSTIKNPEEVAHGTAKKLVTAKLKETKKIISDMDRDDR